MNNEVKVRKSGEEIRLDREEFRKRFNENFFDPYFDPHREKISELEKIAWKAHDEGRKSPVTQKAKTVSSRFKDPHYELSVEWIKAREAILNAQKQYEDPQGKDSVLLIQGSHRNDQTCPGEISKSSRIMQHAQSLLEEMGVEVKILDLSSLNSEYGKKIHPCKGCVSTAMPLCHWPCSCYPNHSLGQVQDWMNEIYPMWVRAHGVFIITPVYWHQSPSALKLMIDRLVCADGGNPDPTSTQGKDPKKAKEIELAGWDYPRHLEGRVFSVVVHGDAAGLEDSKKVLCDWLEEIKLISSGAEGKLDRYIGYLKPYATSHEALDKDKDLFCEIENTARALALNVRAKREGRLETLSPDLPDPRPK
jgi:multimeric flavodoxin WrbA